MNGRGNSGIVHRRQRVSRDEVGRDGKSMARRSGGWHRWRSGVGFRWRRGGEVVASWCSNPALGDVVGLETCTVDAPGDEGVVRGVEWWLR